MPLKEVNTFPCNLFNPFATALFWDLWALGIYNFLGTYCPNVSESVKCV